MLVVLDCVSCSWNEVAVVVFVVVVVVNVVVNVVNVVVAARGYPAHPASVRSDS